LHFHHDFIGTEHVLLGLFSAEDGIVPAVLKRMGIEHGKVRVEVEKIVASQPGHIVGPMIPYTPRARRALRLAAEEAKSLCRAEVGPEHILLGLLREGEGVAGLVLRSLGVNVEKTRAEILKELP
jgi:ATP-dependent Clp protease ATP-binding subunit ClpC